MFVKKKFLTLILIGLLLPRLWSQSTLKLSSNLESRTEQLIFKADSLIKKKIFSKSNKYLYEAIMLLKQEKRWQEVFPLVFKLNDNINKEQKYNQSIFLLKEYQNLAKLELGEKDSLTALTIHKIGEVYRKKGKPRKAIEYFKSALKIRGEIYEKPHPDFAKGFHNIGICFKDLEELDSTVHYLSKSLNSHSIIPYSFIIVTYRLFSQTLSDLREFDKAENYLKLILDIGQKKYKKQPWKIAKIYSDQAYFYLSLNQFEKARQSCQKALMIYDSLKSKYREDYIEMALCYNNLGFAYQRLKNYSKALEQFENAYNLGIKYWHPISNDFADINVNMGITFKKKKEYPKAEKLLKRGLKLYQELNNELKIADTHNDLGDLYYDQNQYPKALKNYHQSLPYLLKNFQEKDEYKNPILKDHYIPDKQALLIFLEAKAKTFKALYDQNHQEKDLKAAHQTYQLLDELIDDIRLSYLEDASKSYLVKQAKPIYEKAIGICLQYHQYSQDKKYLAEAFKYAEKSKAIILLEQIKESRANIASSIPDSVQQKERQLKKEIGQIEKKLALQGEDVTADSLGKSLREQLIRVKNEYEDLVKTLEKNNKEYHQLKYDLQTVDISTIQQEVLKDGQQLVEYFVGVDSMYLFSIGKEQFEIIARPLDFDLKAWTDSLRQGIYYCRINSEITKKDCQALDRQYEQYAAKLYQKLIAPLNLTAETKEIIFIPDGVLGYIPFDALLTKAILANQQNKFQSYPYFGLEKVMSYAFSATFLKELQQAVSTIDNHQLLAFAPSFKVGVKEGVILKITPSEEAQDPTLALRSSLSPLLFNEREVEQIGVNFGGKSYLHQQANKASFMQEVPNYRYLHIASHGKMNDADADLSYIAFTQDGDSTNQDELLYLRELYDMNIPADMVVLSACETGIGELQNGEGIISLARGFSYAGAKSIITSLWSVNDQKTTDLMVDFYQNLKEGETKAYALANAKRDYITVQKSATFSHPFYWAGFIPIGNMESVQAATDWTWFVYGLAGISLLAGFTFWQSKRTKRKSPPIAA